VVVSLALAYLDSSGNRGEGCAGREATKPGSDLRVCPFVWWWTVKWWRRV